MVGLIRGGGYVSDILLAARHIKPTPLRAQFFHNAMTHDVMSHMRVSLCGHICERMCVCVCARMHVLHVNV